MEVINELRRVLFYAEEGELLQTSLSVVAVMIMGASANSIRLIHTFAIHIHLFTFYLCQLFITSVGSICTNPVH